MKNIHTPFKKKLKAIHKYTLPYDIYKDYSLLHHNACLL